MSIPKIIHQLWIGPPMPDNIIALRKSVVAQNPDYLHILWDEARLDNEHLSVDKICHHYHLPPNPHPAIISTLARIHILLRYGGVYLDTDIECIRPIAPLFSDWISFALGLQQEFNGQPFITDSVVGCVPRHSILRAVQHKAGYYAARPNNTWHYFNTIWPEAVRDSLGPDCLLLNADTACRQGPQAYLVHHWARSWRTNPHIHICP